MKKVTLPCDGTVMTAEYAPHELELMAQLRAGLDGPDAEWNRDTMLMIHELKAHFPGSWIVEGAPPEFRSDEVTPSELQVNPDPWIAASEETRRAIKQVEENADEAWKEEALAAVRATCEALPEFISDDVWERGLDSTREDRALGPVLMKAKKEGWCVKTDRLRPSVRSHLSGKPVWRSLLYQVPYDPSTAQIPF